jgi:hypothetical protein
VDANGRIRFNRRTDTNDLVASIDPLIPGQWVHVVGVADTGAGLIRLYLNGVEVNTAASSGANPAVTALYQIGDASNALGAADECALWDRALTPSEVSILYNGGNGFDYSDFGSEADLVVSRLPNLTAGEETAVRAFVDGCEADGTWAKIHDLWCPALGDETDATTGWKLYAATEWTKVGTVTHNPGEGFDYAASSAMQSAQTWDQYPMTANRTGIFVYLSDPGAAWPGNANLDVFGLTGGTGNESYKRVRSSGNNYDDNLTLNHTSATPRPTAFGATHTDDLIGMFQDADASVKALHPGGSVPASVARTDGTKSNVAFFWNGRNNGGSPNNAFAVRHSFWLWTDGMSEAEVLLVRTRTLTLLTALGVTGVPTP